MNCNNLLELFIPQDSYDQYYELLPDYRDIFREESNILVGCDKEKVNLYCLKDYNFSIETQQILEGCIKRSFKKELRSVSISEEQLENIVRSFFDSIYQFFHKGSALTHTNNLQDKNDDQIIELFNFFKFRLEE